MEYCEKQYNSQLGLTFQYSILPSFLLPSTLVKNGQMQGTRNFGE
jgi:hypothetical protein